MRWEDLFGDLEAQLEESVRRDLDLEIADRTRRERAAVTIQERLQGALGAQLEIRTVAGVQVRGELVGVGAGWLVLQERVSPGGVGDRTSLVPLAAVLTVTGVSRAQRGAAVPPGASDGALARLGLGYPLRALSRDRAVVAVVDVLGEVVTGTIDAVGADCFDLAEHPADLSPRAANIRARRLVSFAAVAVVRS